MFEAGPTRVSIGSAIAAAAKAAIVEAGRKLLDNGTHTFWTQSVVRMSTVMSAMGDG